MAFSATQSNNKPLKKQEQIETVISHIEQHSVLGLTDLSGISSKALQGIRNLLRSPEGEVQATIKVIKNTLKKISLEEVAQKGRKDVLKIIPYINGSCAFIFTNTNPFKLQKFLDKNQVPAPAKSGQISPVDVYIPEGATNLDPGPIISELGSIGLQTRIEKGKIRIVKTTKVLSVGETVSEIHAAVLNRLGIQPFEVGLKLSVVLENEELIDGRILEVDEKKILSDLQKAFSEAFSLAVNPKIAYYTKKTVSTLLTIAISQIMSLAIETKYITDNTIDILLARTAIEAKTLGEQITKKDSSLNF
jgi:large subunit ribosomal protein L10